MMSDTLDSPMAIKTNLPLDLQLQQRICLFRQTICTILDRRDPRLLVIVGPCSFHDPEACLHYAQQLKELADHVSETLFLIMRVYVEKPRTAFGWKGYLNDPDLDETYQIHKGIKYSRQYMQEFCQIGLPIASEILNPITYLYFQDLLSWGSIGARTAESQPHREITSNLNFPVGIKNTTAGQIHAAANSIAFASHPQTFLGINEHGQIDIISSPGNSYTHLVLRGSETSVNYQARDIQQAEYILSQLNLPQRIIVDCSHGNANKNYHNQKRVFKDILYQKQNGNTSIVGLILESFLKAGNQTLTEQTLEYGVSITDHCLDFEDTKALILKANEQLKLLKKSQDLESSVVFS